MEKIRLVVAGLGLAAVTMLGAACSGEALAEFGLEKVLAAETGEDIDIDFDLDEGTLRVEGPDGEFAIDTEGFADGGGTFSLEDDGETVTGTFGEGGFEMQTADGSFATSVNDDGSGSTTLTDSDGTTTTFDFATSRPDDWPRFIGEPATVIAADTLYTSGDVSHAVFNYEPGEAYLQALIETLTAEGFEPVNEMNFDGTITMTAVNHSTGVGVQILGSDAEGFASISVGSADQF